MRRFDQINRSAEYCFDLHPGSGTIGSLKEWVTRGASNPFPESLIQAWVNDLASSRREKKINL